MAIKKSEALKYPSIPEPTPDAQALLKSVLRLKENVELLTGQRGSKDYSITEGVFELRKQVGTSIAVIREINDLIVSSTSAIAKRITEVEALANGATAGGAVYLIAQAGDLPGGTLAKYGWRINVNPGPGEDEIFTGMSAIVREDGTSAISFDAGSFSLYDPRFNDGTPTAVFNYDGEMFTFNVDVRINGALIVSGTVDHDQIKDGAVSTAEQLYGAPGEDIVITMPLRKNARVLITAVTDNGEVDYEETDRFNVLGKHKILVGIGLADASPTVLVSRDAAYLKDIRFNIERSGGFVTHFETFNIWRALTTTMVYKYVAPRDDDYKFILRTHGRDVAGINLTGGQLVVLEVSR